MAETALQIRRPSRLPLESIRVLESGIGKIAKNAPAGSSFSFSQEINFLTGRSGAGKSLFMKALHASLTNALYRQEYPYAKYAETFLAKNEIWTAMRGAQRIALDRLSEFTAQHMNCYVFRRYLQELNDGSFEALQEERPRDVSISSFRALHKLLHEDNNLNRFFWMEVPAAKTELVLPFYQALPAFDSAKAPRLGRFDQRYTEAGSLNTQLDYDRRQENHLDIAALRRLLKIPLDASRLDPEHAAQLQKLKQAQFTPGETMAALWISTETAVRDALDRGIRYLPIGQGTSMSRAPFEAVPISHSAQAVVFLDEPTTFLDLHLREAIIKRQIKLLEDFPGRLQFVVCSHDPDYLRSFGHRGSYLNFFEQPAAPTQDFELIRESFHGKREDFPIEDILVGKLTEF